MKYILFVVTTILGVVALSNGFTKAYRPRPPTEYNENSCPRRCSEDYYPFCAVNKVGETKVFVNDCYMAMENCNQLAPRIFYATNDSDCPEFGEWINEDDRKDAF